MKIRLLICFLLSAIFSKAQEPPYDYALFTNSGMTGDYFFSNTSFRAPSLITQKNNRLPVSEKFFHTPGNSLMLEFTNGKNGKWHATVSREPIRGQDHFRPAKFLSFWLYVASGDSLQRFLPDIRLTKKDKTSSASYVFGVSAFNHWERVVIPVNLFFGPQTLSPEIISGIIFSQHYEDGGKHTIYIDDIELIPEVITRPTALNPPVIQGAKGYARHVDITWNPVTDTLVRFVKVYRSEQSAAFDPIGIQLPTIDRYADYTGKEGHTYQYKISLLDKNYHESEKSRSVRAHTVQMTDDELLDMVQDACFRYYWEGCEKQSGMAREDIPGRENMIAAGASGFGIMALIVGAERNFVPRPEIVDRFTRIVNFLDTAETFHGAFPHFIDGPSGKVEPFFGSRDNGGDLVETSFLLQGLLAARAYFKEDNSKETNIRNKITSIWHRVEWDWYKQFQDSKFLYWHWSPDKAWIINHRLIGWNETMVTYLLAIASPTHPVPASMYYSGWASQENFAQQYRQDWGGTNEGSLYRNGNTYFNIKLDVGVSDGGPLFFTHYSYMGYDPHFITDKYTNYFKNNKNIALINYRYCVKNPDHYSGYGDSCWGLTASDGPYDYSADEPVPGRDMGKIAPTGAISSFPYTPEESLNALKNYYYNYGKFLWGAYGFRDAFNLSDNWRSGLYMGLNQAPMAVMIENYRTGLIWKLFMSDNDIKAGLQKLDTETGLQKK